MRILTFFLAAVLLSGLDNTGNIVAMYASKDTRGLGGYFEVSVDGRKVAKLRYGTYYRIAVPPGAYTIKMDAPSESLMICHVIAGESCYVRARLVGKDNRRQAALVSPEEGARQLRHAIPLEKAKIYLPEWK